MIDKLSTVSIFEDLKYSDLETIVEFCTWRELNAGDTLILENDQGNSDLYVLCKGSVEVTSSASDNTSDEVTISKLDKEILGEISWLNGSRRSATIRCVDTVEVIHIDGNALMDFITKNPTAGLSIMHKIARFLARRLDGTDNLLKQILWNSNI